MADVDFDEFDDGYGTTERQAAARSARFSHLVNLAGAASSVVLVIGLGIWGSSYSPRAVHAPFGPDAWAVLALGAVLGGLAGWYRGKTVTIEKEPDGSLMAQASPLGLILLVVLFAGRAGLRDLIEAHAADWHLNAMAVTDAFLVFAMGLIVLQRVEMYIRAKRVQAGGVDPHVEVVA